MEKTKIKIWIILAFVTIAGSSAIGYKLLNKELYKGVDPLEQVSSELAQTSVFGSDPIRRVSTMQSYADSFADENDARIRSAKNAVNRTSQKQTVTQSASTMPSSNKGDLPVRTSPCAPGETPIFGGGHLVRCQSPTDCEAQGKTTYRGEDTPGLLYGMCI